MENNMPYVFISYAHKNSDMVLPCIQAMMESGINIWYDEGIEAGSEWPEFLAKKLVECDRFVLFMSKAYMESQNCKHELSFAVKKKKPILTIFIEDVQLTDGIDMQLSPYQAIHRSRFHTVERFHESVCREPYFASCNPNYQNDGEEPNYTYTPPIPTVSTEEATIVSTDLPVKKRSVAVLLAFFLGGFGIHKFYLRQKGLGFLYLILFLASIFEIGTSQIFAIITPLLSTIEAIKLIVSPEEKLIKKYKCVFK